LKKTSNNRNDDGDVMMKGRKCRVIQWMNQNLSSLRIDILYHYFNIVINIIMQF